MSMLSTTVKPDFGLFWTIWPEKIRRPSSKWAILPSPKAENKKVIQVFNEAHPKAFHVLGNHDMDEGFSREEVTRAFEMSGRYYSEDLGAIQLIVLDGNDPGPSKSKDGYPSYIAVDQQAWLISELKNADKPVLIVSHQPIAGIYTIDNPLEIQVILGRFDSKILLAINGHAHVDQHIVVGGINYLHINSASYYWVGSDLAHESLPPEIFKKYPHLKSICPYSEALFAVLSIDPAAGKIAVKGRKAQRIGPSPQELGYAILNEREQAENLKPEIDNRKMVPSVG
jgi:Icc protein